MTTELTKAAQQALEQLEFLNACYPHKTAADAIASLQSALTQRPAAQTERDTGPRVLREVFALCEDTMDKMAAESTEFSRGRAFEAKGISRAIGTWFQDEYCGRSYMGEPSLPAPQQGIASNNPTPDDSFVVITYRTNDISLEPTKDFQRIDCTVNGIDGTIEARRADENTADIGRVVAFADERATPEPTVTFATVRDAEDELHIECRFSDGQKFAAVHVAQGFDNLAHRIETMLNRDQQSAPERHLTVTTNQQGDAVMVSWQDDEHRILEVVWEREQAPQQAAGEPVGEREQLRTAQAAAVMPLIGPLLDAWESADREAMKEAPELSKQLKAINIAMENADTRPAPGVPEDAEVDRILSTPIPGGSVARDWFLPHETPKGLANVRDVVRAMLAAAQAKGGEHGDSR